MMEYVHVPVLLEEVVSWLKPEDGKKTLMVDGTLGEGGHAAQFLGRFPEICYVGVDADPRIMEKARFRLAGFGDRCRFFNQWYDDFFANYPLDERPARVLLDLGISIFHYQESQRGFSFAKDEPLDMRLSETAGPSVARYLAGCSEAELADVLFQYGEERYSRRIARAVVALRQSEGTGRILALTSRQLAEIVWQAVPHEYRHGRIHPATRSFQALRIMVNGELDRIRRVMAGAFEVLEPGGRLGIISFHSLEDRLVKHFFQDLGKACICPPEKPRCECGGKPRARILTRKPVEATEDECRSNPPSRSARFRVVEKL